MTTAIVSEKIAALMDGTTGEREDAKRLVQRKSVTVCCGSLAVKAVFSGCILLFERNVEIRACRVSDLTGVATHAADTIKISVDVNDSAGGGLTAIGHWDTTTGQEAALTALHMENMHMASDRIAVAATVAAPKALCLTLAAGTGGVGAGKVTHLVVTVEYDEVG
jgi:hypothetical protein